MNNVTADSDPTPVPRKRGLFPRIIVGFLKVGVILAVLVIVTGFMYEFIGHRQDERHFPQEGQSVDVGGYRLNLHCTGAGSPTVVLEGGLGISAIGWKAVQSQIETFTRVCSYDRAGTGWSDPGPLPRNSLQMVKELHTLLHNGGVQPPYVLVGHSLGGFNVRVYNGQYPDEVAGIVLADASSEDAEANAPASMKKAQDATKEQWRQWLAYAPILFRFGIGRQYLKHAWGEKLLPPGFQSEFAFLQFQAKELKANADELDSFEEDGKEAHQSGTFGDKPLIVLTAGRGVSAAEVPPGTSKKELDDYHQMWINDLQPRLAHLSTRGKQIVVPDSGHMIPMEKPLIVVSAVREICATVNVK